MIQTDLTLIALCAAGLEQVVSREIEHLGFKPYDRKTGRVYFQTDISGAAKALVGLRTVERLIVSLGVFRVEDFDDLYDGIRKLPWEDYIDKDDSVTIARIRIHNSEVNSRQQDKNLSWSQTAVQSVAHKSIYDRLSARYRISRLPETGNMREIRLYIEEGVCTTGMDLSGENLSRRGYRKLASKAPLRETLAASMVLLSAWRRKYPLFDPLCGSGTIPIEAALFAADIAPGLNRSFGMETMPFCSRKIFLKVREEAKDKIRNDVRVRIFGSDNDPEVLKIAGVNAARAGVSKLVKFTENSLENSSPLLLDDVGEDQGFIFSNPPYGNRMGTKDEAYAVWKEMAILRDQFPGWAMGFITDEENFPMYFGSKPDHRWAVSSGKETLHYCFWRMQKNTPTG